MKCGNFSGTIITVTFASPNTELAVTHELVNSVGGGVIPRGYIVARRDLGSRVYESGTAWTTTTAYLKCDTTNAVCYIIFFV